MGRRLGLLLLGWLCLSPGMRAATGGGGQSWMADRALMTELRNSGDAVERPHARLWFDPAALSAAEREHFADLVESGIVGLRAWLGAPPAGRRRICYFISAAVEISHSRSGCVFLPLVRVRRHSAPYLHETTHVLAPCDRCPTWFSEGFASYLQSALAAQGGGYDGAIFTQHGNAGVDRDARRWLRTPEGRAVIGYIGADGEPPEMTSNREQVAAPFYVLAQSFVKFLAAQAGTAALRRLLVAPDFDAAFGAATGVSLATWKRRWLAALAGGRRAPGRR